MKKKCNRCYLSYGGSHKSVFVLTLLEIFIVLILGKIVLYVSVI